MSVGSDKAVPSSVSSQAEVPVFLTRLSSVSIVPKVALKVQALTKDLDSDEKAVIG